MDRERAAVLYAVYRAWAAQRGIDRASFSRRCWSVIEMMGASGQEPEHWVDAAAFIFDQEGGHAPRRRRST